MSKGPALLSGPEQGRKALLSLDADDEEAAARRNNRPVESLRKVLNDDPSAWLSRTGDLFYVDHAEAEDSAADEDEPAEEPSGAATAQSWDTFPASETFELHSRPGSQRTIFLDFDGYTLGSNASWVSSGLVAKSYDGFALAGSNNFTASELDYIQTVWRIVSEKYAALDVDVTTEQPSDDALNRSSAGDLTFGTRVVITNDMSARGTACTATSSGGCVGIAYVNVFGALNEVGSFANFYEPAWVFARFTSSSSVRSAGSTAETAAHEIGHTLGLAHDRISGGGSYYEGHDNWHPIMGSSGRAIGQFTNGSSYSGESTTQVDPVSGLPNTDDFDVMQKAGAPLRADDVTGTVTLSGDGPYSREGVIERVGDTDTYAIDRPCTGTFTASAQGIGMGQAVDLTLTVRNPSGDVVASDNPTSGANTSGTPDTPLGVDASATVANAGTGRWTFTVGATGVDGSSGYPAYGSRGEYRLDVGACGTTQPADPDEPSGAFSAEAPVRILDTRNGIGGASDEVGPRETLSLQVAGRGDVPSSGASAVILNLTATQGTRSGYVTAYPSGISRPSTSNVTWALGRTIATHTTVKLGPDGVVKLYNASSGSVHLIADVAGWYREGAVTEAGMFTPVVPARLADEVRTGAMVTLGVQIAGNAGIPSSGVGGAALNVTVDDPSKPGYITGYPDGAGRPNASNVNFLAGQTIANAATLKTGSNGRVALFNGAAGSTDITADVAGWFSAGTVTAAGGFTSLDPVRLLDTRNGIGASKAQVGAGRSVTLTVAGLAGVPSSGAGAAVLNVTVTRGTASGYVTAYPAGESRPNASSVNFVAGQTVPNLVTVKLGSGRVTFYNGSTKPVDVIADIAGWYRG